MAPKSKEIFFIEPPGLAPISHTVEEAIEVIGVGKLQILGVAASLLCLMNYILDVLGLGFIIPAATCDLQMDTFKKGLLTSVPFLGLTLTSHLWGFFSDSMGRKSCVCRSLSCALLFSSLAAFAPNYWLMLALRFLSGLSFSGSISGTYPYIGEILPKKARSHMLSLFGFAAGSGMLITSGVGILLKNYGGTFPITEDYSITSWRIQMLVLLIPGAIALCIYCNLPESPKFLMTRGEPEKALEVLRTIHQANCSGKEEFPIKLLTDDHSATVRPTSLSEFFKGYKEETMILLGTPFRWPLLGCCFVQYGIFTVGASFILWYPEITNRLGDSSRSGFGICDNFSKPTAAVLNETLGRSENWEDCSVQLQDKMYIDNMFIGVGYLVANTLYSLSNMKFNLQYVCIVSMAVSGISAFTLPSLTDERAILVFFSIFLIGSGACINIFIVVMVQIFPFHLCGMALSLTLLTGRLGAFIGANGLGVLLDTHCEVTIYGVATLISLITICAYSLPKKVGA